MQKRLCLVRIPPPLLLFFANKRENFAYRPYLRWWWSRPGLRAVSLYQSVCVCVLHVSFFFFWILTGGNEKRGEKKRKGIIIKRDFDAQYFISVGVAPLADNVNLWVARPSFLYPVTALFIIIFFLTFSALWIVGHLSFSLGGGGPVLVLIEFVFFSWIFELRNFKANCFIEMEGNEARDSIDRRQCSHWK